MIRTTEHGVQLDEMISANRVVYETTYQVRMIIVIVSGWEGN